MSARFARIAGLLALTATVGSAETISWITYTDPQGMYTINYPEGWQTKSQGRALVISSQEGSERGVFGITLRGEGVSKESAVEREFADPNRPEDLQKVASRIANQPAIKVWGSKKGDPSIKSVEYYVEKGTQEYYILFQAPHAAMARYSPIFNAMIASFKFAE